MNNIESLQRATSGQSTVNLGAIYSGFAAMGIDDIQPRVNVLTFKAWLAKGRTVQKGQHGVKCITWIPTTKDGENKLMPRTVTVFHINQTREI